MPFAKLDDTLEMYYEDDLFADPWRHVETIVMHHGNAKNSRLWYAWVPLLARQYRVIRLDARGFGRSSLPPEGYDWSLSNFSTDVLRLLDHLELDKVHLIGETVGGTISLQFAYEHPERLHSLTVCSSPYKFTGVSTFLDSHKLVQEEGVASWVRKTADHRVDPKANPGHHQWYTEQMSQTSQRVILETLSYLSKQDLTQVLPQIKTPALILVAEDSVANNPDRTQGIVDLMPDTRLLAIPGTTGYVQHSAPEKCVTAWREFIGLLSHR